MEKTGMEIEQEIWTLAKESEIARQISGNVYRSGTRPRDSRSEDMIVRFTAGTPGEWQTGLVTILIYVPDIVPDPDGSPMKDGIRLTELEQQAACWVEEISDSESSSLQLDLAETIRSFPDSAVSQHFISIKLTYHLLQQ